MSEKERRTLVCVSNGKKVSVPNVSKVYLALRTKERHQVQVGIDLNEGNIRTIRAAIRGVNPPGPGAPRDQGLTFPEVWPSGAPVRPEVKTRYKRELAKIKRRLP